MFAVSLAGHRTDLMPDNEEESQEVNEPMPQATQEDQETIDNDNYDDQCASENLQVDMA